MSEISKKALIFKTRKFLEGVEKLLNFQSFCDSVAPRYYWHEKTGVSLDPPDGKTRSAEEVKCEVLEAALRHLTFSIETDEAQPLPAFWATAGNFVYTTRTSIKFGWVKKSFYDEEYIFFITQFQGRFREGSSMVETALAVGFEWGEEPSID